MGQGLGRARPKLLISRWPLIVFPRIPGGALIRVRGWLNSNHKQYHWKTCANVCNKHVNALKTRVNSSKDSMLAGPLLVLASPCLSIASPC